MGKSSMTMGKSVGVSMMVGRFGDNVGGSSLVGDMVGVKSGA